MSPATARSGDITHVASCAQVEDSQEAKFPSDPGSDLPGVGLDGTSGHSNFRRFRFAIGGFGPYIALLVLLNSKEVYVLKLGANAARLAPFFVVFAFASPILYPVAGRLMDREPPLIAWRGWGRRAPWYLFHLLLLAVACGLVFLAPENLLEVWLGIILTLSAWGLAVVLNAIEAAYAEIYPFKEERALVQAMFKFVGVGSSVAGLAPLLILLAVATQGVRIAISVLYMVCLLLSLEVVPILNDARQPRKCHEHNISFSECLEVLENPAMFHATMIRFWQGAADATSLTFSVYYLAYVCKLDGASRSQWLFVGGFIIGPMDLILTFVWSLLWGGKEPEDSKTCVAKVRRSAPTMRHVCLCFHLVAALVCPLILWLLPKISAGIRPWEMIIFSTFLRFCYSPQTFFRNSTFCWTVDEDCQMGGGRRREAVHAGVIKCLEEFGRAVGACLFVGLGFAGLDTENCEAACDAQANERSCVHDCEIKEIERQPKSVSEYILAMHYCAIPLFGLLCAWHIWRFPIHGVRLEDLQQKQSVTFKAVNKIPPRMIGMQ